MDFQKIWIEQCDAAEGIKERFGTQDSIRYLIGEKFINFLRESGRRPEFARELPKFSARVKEIFEQYEIVELLDSLLHERSADPKEEWVFDDFEDAELDPHDVVDEAETIALMERAKELLLDK